MLVGSAVGLVRAVLARIHHDEREALRGSSDVGQASRARAVRGILHGAVVIAAIRPDLLERRRIGMLRRDRRTRGEVESIRIVDVVVSVDDEELRLHARRLQLLARGGYLRMSLLMTDQLAILRQVARNEDHIRLRRDDARERGVEDGGALLEHLAVGVLGGGVIGAVAPKSRREIVQVGHDGDLHLTWIPRSIALRRPRGFDPGRKARRPGSHYDHLEETPPAHKACRVHALRHFISSAQKRRRSAACSTTSGSSSSRTEINAESEAC